MPRRTLLLLCVVLICTSDALGRERPTPVKRIPQIHTNRVSDSITGAYAGPHSVSLSTTTNDTTVLGYWTFDTPPGDPQGWTSVDRTAQTGVYFHVDDFAGLGGGDFGRLHALEGNQSMWCGARESPSEPFSCGYATLPGYGNQWDQMLVTVSCLDVAGDVVIDYKAAWDSEIKYDPTMIEVDECDERWSYITGGDRLHEGVGSGVQSIVVPESRHDGIIRIRFRFTSDTAWSDEDGIYDTDGAIIIDSLTVSDTTGVILPTELFEVESVGDTITASGNWVARAMPGYGDFAGLFPGAQVVQEDVCGYTPSYLWGFFTGSTWDYSCGGWPEQQAVPYGNIRRQFIDNQIWSPLIPWNWNFAYTATLRIGFRAYIICGMFGLLWAGVRANGEAKDMSTTVILRIGIRPGIRSVT
jgi:hypothetical protein